MFAGIARWSILAVFVLVTLATSSSLRAQGNAGESAPAAVTFDDVLKLLELGIDEPAIRARLEKSPTRFTLDAAQIERLKKAGASPALIAAMKDRPAEPGGGDVANFAILLDCSGSMLEKTPEGETKMEVAKRIVAELVRNVPDGLGLTFLIYGHDKKLACQAVNVLRPLSEIDAEAKSRLTAQIEALQPAGATPIALALRTAGEELAKQVTYCSLVVISDGKETCKGNPADEAARLASRLKLNDGFGVNVVGFDVGQDRAALEAVAQAGRGTYYNADSARELSAAISSVQAKLKAATAPKQRAPRGFASSGSAVSPGGFFHDAPRVAPGEYQGKLAFMETHYYQTPVRSGQELRVVGVLQKAPYEAMNATNHQTFSVTIYRPDLQIAKRESVTVTDTPKSPVSVRAVWTPDFDGVAYVSIAASDNHSSGKTYGDPIEVYKPEKPDPSQYTLRIRGADEPTEAEAPQPIVGREAPGGAGFDDAADLAIGELTAADVKLGEAVFYRFEAVKGRRYRVTAAMHKPWYNAFNYQLRARYTLTAYDEDQVQIAQQSLEVSKNPPDAHGLALEFTPEIDGAAYLALACENAGAAVYPEDFDPLPGRIALRLEEAP